MSRFWDDFDGDDPRQVRLNNLWGANIKRAIRGARGQQWLREMRAALLALPEKRLIEDALCEHGWDDNDQPERAEFCAVGALAYHKRVAAGERPAEVIEDLARVTADDYESEFEIEAEAKRIGLGAMLARHFAFKNDETFGGLKPEQRFAKYLAWVESQIIENRPV